LPGVEIEALRAEHPARAKGRVRVQPQSSREAELIEGLHSLHFIVSVTHRKILTIISELDERKLWRDEGCRDMAQWLSGQLGISAWIAAAGWLPPM
jgi:hypothetical protein